MARTDVYLFYPVANCTRSVFGRVIRGGPSARHIRAVGHSRNDQTDAVRVCRPRLLFLANYSGLSRINWPGPTPTATIIVRVRHCVINLTNLLPSPPLRSVLSTRSVTFQRIIINLSPIECTVFLFESFLRLMRHRNSNYVYLDIIKSGKRFRNDSIFRILANKESEEMCS